MTDGFNPEDTQRMRLDRLKVISENLTGPEYVGYFIDAIPDAVIVVNVDGEIVLFNAQAEFLFGYPRAEVLGHPVEVLVPETLRDKHARERSAYIMEPHIRSLGRQDLRLEGRHKTGRTFAADISLGPMVTPGGTFIVAVVRRNDDA